MSKELEFKIAKLALAPNDILVLRVEHLLSDKMVADIKTVLKESAPGHKVIVLDRSMELSVLTAAEIEKRAAI